MGGVYGVATLKITKKMRATRPGDPHDFKTMG
jgi:hypothetical protein